MKLYALAFALMLLGALAHADTIDPGTHAIEKCVKITGLDAYPDYAFLGVVSSITSNSPPTIVQIDNGKCIQTGSHYKFDRFDVYYANKSYIEEVGISGIKTAIVVRAGDGRQGVADMNLVRLGGDTVSAPYMPYYVSDEDDSRLVTIIYEIAPSDGGFAARKIAEWKSRFLHQQESPYPGRPYGDEPPPLPTGNESDDGGDMPPPPPDGANRTQLPPVPTPLAASHPLEAFWCWLIGIFGMKC
jgi:hypothetical protein